MKEKYHFAENINGTGADGIITFANYKAAVVCLCTKENAKLILSALSSAERQEGETREVVSMGDTGLNRHIVPLPKPLGEMSEGWTSVEGRLPWKDGDSEIPCLCWDSWDSQRRVLSFNEHHNCWDQEDGDDYYTDSVGGKVTHWMPLPPPPSEGKEGRETNV